jgi:hypothetical protein
LPFLFPQPVARYLSPKWIGSEDQLNVALMTAWQLIDGKEEDTLTRYSRAREVVNYLT